MPISHTELCFLTANHFCAKSAYMALVEYQSYVTQEFPDVLLYSTKGTVLYEIKTSHSDFLADKRKEARVKYKTPVPSWFIRHVTNDRGLERSIAIIELQAPELFLRQYPHLGGQRYFVCEPGIIDRDELPAGWGLIYVSPYGNGYKWRIRRVSSRFLPDMKAERDLAAHAVRRMGNGDYLNIVVNKFTP